jgi:hypothetical protein
LTGIDQIPSENLSRGKTMHSQIHKLFIVCYRKNSYSGGKNPFYVLLKKVMKLPVIIDKYNYYEHYTQLGQVLLWHG